MIDKQNNDRFTWETASSVCRCSYCKNRFKNKASCKAFPNGITSKVLKAVDNNINYQCSEKYKFENDEN